MAISDEQVEAAAVVLLGRVNAPEQAIYAAARAALEAAHITAPDETAWLIEFSGHGAPAYYGKTAEDGLHITDDHLAAIRFSRAEDAQAVIDDTGWTEAKPVEHMWCEPLHRLADSLNT